MKDWLLDILACPFCKGDLVRIEELITFLPDLEFLRCTKCKAEFPIFLERPILVPKGVEGWLSAIDQAVCWSGPPRADIISLAWLGEQLELGRDLKSLVKWKSMSWRERSRNEWIGLLESLREKAEERRSGRWFMKTERRRRLLESSLAPLPSIASERSTLDEFVAIAVETEPLRLIDVASGGGFAISRILANLDKIEYAVAVEKDLKCLWSIQYKVEYVAQRTKIGRKGLRFEAVGADARKLPFRDESFDFATMYHSLGEICGVSDVLLQVHRVLEPGGRFLLSFHDVELANYVPPEEVKSLIESFKKRRVPLTTQELNYIERNLPKLDRQRFLEFLEAADLFINLQHLEKKVKECGFVIVKRYFHVMNEKRDFILMLKKV